MKQYTNEIQTAKLIELGIEKPKSMNGEHNGWQFMPTPAYSIGELIEMLPICFENSNYDISWLEIEAGAVWSISYSSFGFIDYDCEREKLIDALYDMIICLHNDGII